MRDGANESEARTHAGAVVRRASAELRAKGEAPRGRALLDAADALHDAACRILTIKASPPTYEVTVGSLGDLLGKLFEGKAHPLVGQAVQDLAEIQGTDKPAVAKWQAAKTRVAQLAAAMEATGQVLPDAEAADLGRLLASAYRLGKKEVAQPLGFAADFALRDRDALHALHDSGIYWIGKHYGEALDQPKLLQVVKETMLDQGLGRAAAGRKLAEAFGGEIQKSESYWRGLAATVATRARSFGAIEAMHASGGRRYEFVNPDDEVTSDVCRALNGTTFTVAGGIALRDKLLAAKTPEEWKAISPWPKGGDLFNDEGKALYKAGTFHDAETGILDRTKAAPYLRKPAELQAGGIAWPPLHFHCRSSIVVRVWYPLTDEDVDPYGDVSPEAYKPPTPKKKPKAAPVVDHVPEPLTPPAWTPSFPSQLCPEPFDLDFPEAGRSWTALLRLQGYTDDEIAGLYALDVAPYLPKNVNVGEKLGDLFFASDRETIAAIVAKHPPANPAAFTEFGWLPGEEALAGDAAEGAWGAWADGDGSAIGTWWRVATAGKKGSKAEIAAEILATYDTKGNVTNIMGAAVYNRQEKIEILAFLEDLAKKGDDEALIAAINEIAEEGVVPYAWRVKVAKPPSTPTPPPAVSKPPPMPLPEPPPAAPAAFEVEAEALGFGTSEAHPGYDWHPPTVAALPVREAWAEVLADAGYSPAEVGLLWGTPAKPGPLGKLAAEVQAEATAAGWDTATTAEAARVRFAGELVKHPPAKVVGLNGRPAPFLDPADLGARLSPTTSPSVVSTELGAVHRDAVDGSIWIVAEGTDEYQARSQVAAAALYRRLGIEAPEVRLVRKPGGSLAAAWRDPRGWTGADVPDLAAKAGEELAASMPADAWVGNWNVFGTSGNGFAAVREHPIPGLGGRSLRLSFRGVFDRRFTGGEKPAGAWTAGKVDELATFLDASKAPRAAEAFHLAHADRSRLLPMMDRIGKVTAEEVDAALDLAGFAGAERSALQSTLLGRAKWMGEEAQRLRARIAEEAVARAEAAREAAAAAARAAAARAARAEQIARGEIVPGYVPEGLDLVRISAHLESEGPASIVGDHGVVRDQALRVTRYRMMKGAKATEDGYELHGVLDSEVFDRVNLALRDLGRKPGATLGNGFRAWARVIPSDRSFDRGAVIRFNADAPDGFLGGGLHLETDKWSIDFAGYTVGAGGSGDKYPSMEGKLRIRVKTPDAADALDELRAVVRALGIPEVLDPPTEEARRLCVLNKAAWNVLGSSYKAKDRGVVLGIADAEKALKKAGVDPASIEVVDQGRGYQAATIPGRGTGYRKRDGALYLYHEIADEVGLRGVLGRPGVSGEAGGLLSTTERYLDGLFKGGASSGSDMRRGPGAYHVFTRLIGKESMNGTHSEWYGSFGSHRTILDPRILDRLDWYHNYGDDFGALDPNRKGADQAVSDYARHGSRGHEVMFRGTIPRRAILLWSATDESSRATILAAARANGITTWHGFPIEQMVVVQRRPGDVSKLDRKNPIHAYVLGLRDDLEGVALDD